MARWALWEIERMQQLLSDNNVWINSGKSYSSFWSMQTAYDKQKFEEWFRDGQPTQPSALPGSGTFTNSRYTRTNTSFSGADIVATFTPIGGKPIVFGEIQTISYSIYRPTTPVTALGRINPKGVVRGPRTIAGSLIFTVFDRHVLKELIDDYGGTNKKKSPFMDEYGFTEADMLDLRKYGKTDEIPPFDINISFMNEYGNSAYMNLYGIYILTEGQTMSIEDMITENTMQYIAMDIDLMDYSKSTTNNPY
jgi:hypothetical protein